MPRLTTYALELPLIQKISGELTQALSKLFACPPEHISIQVNQDPFIREGQVVKGDPFIEVCLFEREQEKEDELARIVTETLKRQGIQGVDLYLTHLARRRYYENGEHF